MNASSTTRLKKRRNKHRQKSAYKMVAAEISVKLVVNVLLSVTAMAALTKLLPYQQVQLAKLHLIGVEREEVEKRVEHLREDFSRNFDPNQTRKIMQEQSPRVDPNQRRIFWVSQ
ncbi:hypothetical protein [Gloeothece verrucosa]|uniref:Uncharacterized protein n=1 Tax=Gloeothece verrucosa (strain PCC 7822) TaxID=497965 RepID=E0UKH4_GLOV7|nr:hypothetical protein [Gloeothece verrucosa]ADN17055.1 conserved hypothetical protein [Gloeothece verrucosa PCC 7822]